MEGGDGGGCCSWSWHEAICAAYCAFGKILSSLAGIPSPKVADLRSLTSSSSRPKSALYFYTYFFTPLWPRMWFCWSSIRQGAHWRFCETLTYIERRSHMGHWNWKLIGPLSLIEKGSLANDMANLSIWITAAYTLYLSIHPYRNDSVFLWQKYTKFFANFIFKVVDHIPYWVTMCLYLLGSRFSTDIWPINVNKSNVCFRASFNISVSTQSIPYWITPPPQTELALHPSSIVLV